VECPLLIASVHGDPWAKRLQNPPRTPGLFLKFQPRLIRETACALVSSILLENGTGLESEAPSRELFWGFTQRALFARVDSVGMLPPVPPELIHRFGSNPSDGGLARGLVEIA